MNDLAIYVHWPFCTRICPYCDFNVYKNKQPDFREWATAFKNDLSVFFEKTEKRKISSIYFGGGTPSLMSTSLVESIISACQNLWGLKDDTEITLEANPTDVEINKFQGFKDVGINRLSLGVQSINDTALKFLGRNHSASQAKHAIETSLAIFRDTTFDLIYARKDQTLEQWREELKHALALGTNHLSLYQLTIEPDTAFEKAVTRGDWRPPSEELQACFFEETQSICDAVGMGAYEISNHARRGYESRHNFSYWRCKDYLGIGPGAHGRLTINDTRYEIETVLNPKLYLNTLPQERFTQNTLTAQDRGAEFLLMGLRLNAGISLRDYQEIAKSSLPDQTLNELILQNLVSRNKDTIRLTKSGRAVLNRIVLELLS